MAAPLVSVVCVAREGFRCAPATLGRLLEVTRAFRLIYVDGNAPRRVADTIARAVAACGGTLVRTAHYLTPTDARNLGLREVDTRYVVFLDNDVVVSPGWLGALVACAEDTGAAFVSPVICTGGRTPPKVHVAGGENRVVEDNGARRFVETYDHAARPLADVLAEVSRRPTRMAEFHAVLVRTDALSAAGGLDARCSTAFEHNDLCLSLLARGGTGWLEPASVVDYMPDDAGARENFEYHMLRWCRRWIDDSLAAFCTKWRLAPDDPCIVRDLASLHSRRRRPLARVRDPLRRRMGRRAEALVDAAADWWVDRVLRPRHDGAGAHRAPQHGAR